jgi:hypothetical protein
MVEELDIIEKGNCRGRTLNEYSLDIFWPDLAGAIFE